MKKRILHVISTLNVGSGIANCVMNYYRVIDREKYQFDFLLFNEVINSFTEEVKKMGSNVYYIDKPSIKTGLSYKNKVEKLFKENIGKWDTIHVHEVLVQAVVLPLAKKYGIKKRILHAHGGNIVIPFFKRIRNKFLEIGFKRNATKYYACSNNAGVCQFGDKIVNSENFEVLNNAINIDKYRYKKETEFNLKKEFNLNETSFVMGTIGRISEQKNPFFIINLFENVSKIINNIKFIYFGDGELKTNLVTYVKEKGLEDKIIFAGNRNNIFECIQVIDCFVFPSIWEGLGIVLIEAEAAGIYSFASKYVPKETKVCDRVEYIDLDLNLWTQRIVEAYLSGKFTKVDSYSYMENSNFNIQKEVCKLETYYAS